MLQLRLVQNALFSYLEISAHLSNEDGEGKKLKKWFQLHHQFQFLFFFIIIYLAIQYCKELEPTDETGITINVEQYIEVSLPISI